jgi:hypothetical protein
VTNEEGLVTMSNMLEEDHKVGSASGDDIDYLYVRARMVRLCTWPGG